MVSVTAVGGALIVGKQSHTGASVAQTLVHLYYSSLISPTGDVQHGVATFALVLLCYSPLIRPPVMSST